MKKVVVTDPQVIIEGSDSEAFLAADRSKVEIAEFKKGFDAGSSQQPNDDTKSQAWQRGWAEAQE